MKVYKIVLMVVDRDEVGEQEVADLLENGNYPNDCIAPQVMSSECEEIEWDDDHALNCRRTANDAFISLFGEL